jgi:hypothetical protein
MKKLFVIMLMALAPEAYAQMGDTTNNEGGTVPGNRYQQELPDDLPPTHNEVRVKSFQLPKRLQRTLKRDALYQGWEDGVIYYNTRTELYTVHLTGDSTRRMYQFTRRGQPVAINEIDLED